MPDTCPTCGAACSVSAPRGICPRCLLQTGLDSDALSLTRSGEPSATLIFGPGGTSVLKSLAATLGDIPRVLLRDTETIRGPGPVVSPSSPEMPQPVDRSERLQLLGEIARGGMGAILKGRDADIGRDLAVKVLLEQHRDRPEMLRRFIEEAQIAGQLQHPGVVPVYELGHFADHRPYFAMKLVKGSTLAEVMSARPDPSVDRPRLLAVFLQVSQTIAYAHARGVIHRDLKPSNVMVGAFGEVQVMDWGLAKVLPRGGVIDDASAGKQAIHETIIATARTASDSDLSQAGSILGTPSYMAPEQARGEPVDERADVFALGSILCEILTGTPAFTGRTSGEIQRKAARGELADAFVRLEASDDTELIALAKACLAAEAEDRPEDASVIAERCLAYQAGVQERLREAEIARAAESVRAEEATKRAVVERDRRRLTLALAASVLGFFVLGGAGWTYLTQSRAARRAATERVVTQALDEATLIRGRAKAAAIGDLSGWVDALAAAKQARSLASAGEADAALRVRVDEFLAVLEREQADAGRRATEADRDRLFVERLDAIRLQRFERGDKWMAEETDAAYAKAFREFGVDLDHLDPAEAGAQLSRRSNPLELTFFLDDWAQTRCRTLTDFMGGVKNDTWKRLIEAARFSDPDPWRNGLRVQFGGQNRDALAALAYDEKSLANQPVPSLLLLAQLLEDDFRTRDLAEGVLERAWRLRPDEYMACIQLARVSKTEARRFATAAVALRPRNPWAHEALAKTFLPKKMPFTGGPLQSYFQWSYPKTGPVLDLADLKQEDLQKAIDAYKEAVRLRPDEQSLHIQLARALLHRQGKFDEAMAEYREATRHEPNSTLLSLLRSEMALDLAATGRALEATVELQESLRLVPDATQNHIFLGSLLRDQGKKDAAFAEFREAYLLETPYQPISLDIIHRFLRETGKIEDELLVYRERLRQQPQDQFNLTLLGQTLRAQGQNNREIAVYHEEIQLNPKNPRIHHLLGEALQHDGRLGEARTAHDSEIRLLRDQVRAAPLSVEAHEELAKALYKHGDREGGLKEFREALRINPTSTAITSVGDEMIQQEKVDQALELFRVAVEFKPAEALVHHQLGWALHKQGKLDEAITEYRATIKLKPDDVAAFQNISIALRDQGKPAEALAELREALRLNSKNTVFQNQLAWGFATEADSKNRDGKAAVEFATKACELTEWKNPPYLDTLAAAHAEALNFAEAAKWQAKAIELLSDEKEKEDYRTRLKLYQDKKPYHVAK
jgi:tetratricopeptide (TPR) repeat protein